MMDPLVLVREAIKKKMLPKELMKDVEKRMSYLEWAVKKVEKATGARYPIWYLTPLVLLMQGPLGETAILYARNHPIVSEGRGKKIIFAVEFTLPLHLYASKETLLAVVAHEFTHYVELARRINRFELLSAETTSTVFEARYRDVEEALRPELVFGRHRSIVRLLREKFLDGLSDDALNSRTMKRWVEKGMPVVRISPEENVIRIPVEALSRVELEPGLLRLIQRASESEVSFF